MRILKNFLLCFFCYLILLSGNFFFLTKAKAISKYITFNYAQVLEEEVYLYKTNLSTFAQNAYFEIPKTYFVRLLSNIDETFYKAQYQNYVGFVIKNKVTPVEQIPITPFLNNITFRVYAQDGLKLISSPFSSLNPTVVSTLPALPTLNYISKITADELVKDRGYTWFYCSYQEKEGYVYAGYCDNLTPIPLNNEVVTVISNPFEIQDNEYLYSLINLSPFLKAVIIICVCLPCLIIIFLLFKPFKIKKTHLNNTKNYKAQKTKTINQIQKVIEEDDTI